MIETIRLADKFAEFQDTWSPKIVGELNDSYVKLVKLHGEFIWHQHEREDELFLVVHGHLVIRLRDGEIHLDPGELVIIPHGIEHLPVAEEEVEVLLLERKTTVNTGSVGGGRTVRDLDRL